MEYRRHFRSRLIRHLISAPFIYMVIVPFLFLDLVVEIYHRICFPLYGLAYIKRSKYFIFDRQKLSYLPWYDKINCTYCAYGNGLALYVAAIAAQTEQYWCGIKHQKARLKGLKDEEGHYLKYGDKQSYEAQLNADEKDRL